MFSTTIKKEWWKQKMQQHERQGYFYEYKEHKPYWNKRIENLKVPADAVFLVGSVPHRANIMKISCAEMHSLPMEIVAFFFFSETLNPKQTVKEFRNSKVWVLKCENVIEAQRNVSGITSHAREERVKRTFYPEQTAGYPRLWGLEE